MSLGWRKTPSSARKGHSLFSRIMPFRRSSATMTSGTLLPLRWCCAALTSRLAYSKSAWTRPARNTRILASRLDRTSWRRFRCRQACRLSWPGSGRSPCCAPVTPEELASRSPSWSGRKPIYPVLCGKGHPASARSRYRLVMLASARATAGAAPGARRRRSGTGSEPGRATPQSPRPRRPERSAQSRPVPKGEFGHGNGGEKGGFLGNGRQ